ncbi:MAG: hypothetical protein WCS77_09525 [Elusimicrobiaceae bacterium]
MRQFIFFICAAFLLVSPLSAKSVKTTGAELELDIPDSWSISKKDDPDNILQAASGKTSISLLKRDDELSERYLKMRLNDAIEDVRSKGARPGGDINTLSIHGEAVFFYTQYSLGENDFTIGIFTYGEKSYNFEGRNLALSELSRIASSLRKPGEVIKAPPPLSPPAEEPERKTVKKTAAPAKTARKPAPAPVAVSSPAPVAVSSATPVTQTNISTAPAAEKPAEPAVKQEPTPPPAPKIPAKPAIERHPFPMSFVIAALVLWIALRTAVISAAVKTSYPKMPKPPGELPPDWFFPFSIRSQPFGGGVMYGIRSRHGQLLKALFDNNGHSWIVFGVYGILALHTAWSILCETAAWNKLETEILSLPLGGIIVSLPELPFVLAMAAGIAMLLGATKKLSVYDKDDEIVVELRPCSKGLRLRDGKGKELGVLTRTSGKMASRSWRFRDADNQYVFDIVDDCPWFLWARRLFGNCGGKLRARYSFFVKDKRAGFVMNDPLSSNRYQFHGDYSYARLTRPINIVAALLYAESADCDYFYPWL